MHRTKAECEADLAEHLESIEALQESTFNATGFYAKVMGVLNASHISVAEYKGGGDRSDPHGDPGYLIVQEAVEDGVVYHKITDKGPLGRSADWFPIDTPSIEE